MHPLMAGPVQETLEKLITWCPFKERFFNILSAQFRKMSNERRAAELSLVAMLSFSCIVTSHSALVPSHLLAEITTQKSPSFILLD